MLVKENTTLQEADVLNPDMFSDPAAKSKLSSRIKITKRAITSARNAADRAEEQGDLDLAAKLRQRANELQELVDTAAITYEEDNPADGASEGSGKGDGEDEAEDTEDSEEDTEDSKKEKDGSDKTDDQEKSGETDSEKTGEPADSKDSEGGTSYQQSSGQHHDDTEGGSGQGGSPAGGQGPSDGGNGSSGGGKTNPFEIDVNAMSRGGSQSKKSANELETIIELLKKLSGEGKDGAIAGLKKIISDRGYSLSDFGLSESLITLPKKPLSRMSDREFDEIIDNLLDEIDAVTPLPFVDEGERAEKIKKIKDMMDNGVENAQLAAEDRANSGKAKRGRSGGLAGYAGVKSLAQFEINFWRAIKDQVDKVEEEEDSWLAINSRYESEANTLKKGTRTEEYWEENKPSVDLFFDMSGSWTSDTTALQVGKRAVATLKEFVERDEIDLRVYYFSDIVTQDVNSPALGQGTGAWNEILDTIKADQAKNVVLMTDGDMNWSARSSSGLTVEGCVWFLWKDAPREEIFKKLKGKISTEQFVFS